MPPRKIPFGTPAYAAALPFTTGKYLFVCNASGASGSDGNTGLKPELPLATIQKANDLATAGANDVVVLMPGHAETVTATNVALSTAGVQYIGIGTGLARPTFTYGAAAATFTVSGANISIRNCVFIANFADVAAAITLGAAKDFTVDGCSFTDVSNIKNFLSCVVTGATNNAADGLTVTGNYVQSLPATDGAFISVLGNLDRLNASDNFVNKAATNDAGHFLTVSSKVLLGARVYRNTLNVVGATNAGVGVFATGSSTTNTGVFAYNLTTSLDTTAALFITAALNFAVHENYMSGVVAASGTLFPAADNPA